MSAACFNAGTGLSQVYNDVVNVLWLAAMAPGAIDGIPFPEHLNGVIKASLTLM